MILSSDEIQSYVFQEQMNVILVDWSDAFFSNENPVNYTRAALATKAAALNVKKYVFDSL